MEVPLEAEGRKRAGKPDKSLMDRPQGCCDFALIGLTGCDRLRVLEAATPQRFAGRSFARVSLSTAGQAASAPLKALGSTPAPEHDQPPLSASGDSRPWPPRAPRVASLRRFP
jgi:hypothetical protein